MRRSVLVDERRARLGVRHRLRETDGNPVEVARSLVALHSSDPSTVFLTVAARTTTAPPAVLEQALYEDRSLVRILGMRRTIWVVPTPLAAVINSSSTKAVATAQRRRTASMLESAGVTDDGPAWYERVSERVLSSLRERGEATAREITADVPELAQKLTFYKKDGSVMGEVGASTRVLFMLATEGRIIRARPLGSWISSQYRWSTMENWLGSDLDDLDRAGAQAEVLGFWLRSYGPATETDIKWWTGWPVTEVRSALTMIAASEVDLDEGTGFLHPDDTERVTPTDPWVALLPSLDPTTMGWKEREWYLGEFAARLFDRNGNAGPTVWVDGKIVGGWAQRKTGEVVYEVFEDVGSEADEAIATRAAALQDWLGDTVVTPRFRSPHDKALTV